MIYQWLPVAFLAYDTHLHTQRTVTLRLLLERRGAEDRRAAKDERRRERTENPLATASKALASLSSKGALAAPLNPLAPGVNPAPLVMRRGASARP